MTVQKLKVIFGIIWVMTAIFTLSIMGVVGYVAMHFILKVW